MFQGTILCLGATIKKIVFKTARNKNEKNDWDTDRSPHGGSKSGILYLP